MNNHRVAELRGLIDPDSKSDWITNQWNKYNQQRQPKMEMWSELSKYLFATDTTTTSNSKLKWTHSTTTPKLTQIRDNLHANYMASLFPNDKWLTWEAFDGDAAKKEKAKTIQAYMENKVREGKMINTVSQLVYDYIDYGNCFAMPSFETRYKETDSERITSFIGPKCQRISPYDIVFNPLASSFENTFKIVRSMTTVGALKKLAMTNPDQKFWEEGINRREMIAGNVSHYGIDEWQKAEQYAVDGFGSLHEYYQSDAVEVLDFYGDYHDSDTGEFHTNRMITVIDRSIVVRDVPIKTYGGEAPIRKKGWRDRPDNLWSMGPLDNLVGMQYLIDHYINMGANALDLKIMPPKKIIGDVEQFDWEPNAEIHLDENGDVQEMAQQFGDIYTAQQWVEALELRMEMYAGAPKEAMGIRSPGEKTAFEVQVLENASSRLFNEKIVQFELFLEEILNDMLEIAHRNLDVQDIIKIVDKDIGAQRFKSITKEDISANGILRPVGARHFAQKANELQNIVGLAQSPIWGMIQPHTSGKAMAEFVNSVIDLRGYDMFKPYAGIAEQQELQTLVNQAQQDIDMIDAESEEDLMLEGEANEQEVDLNAVPTQ